MFVSNLLLSLCCCWFFVARHWQRTNVKDVSCEQFLAMDETSQNAIVYWIDGIETATNASKNSVGAAEIAVGYDALLLCVRIYGSRRGMMTDDHFPKGLR